MNLDELANIDAALERVKAALPKDAASESMVCSDIQDLLPALIAIAHAAQAWRDATEASTPYDNTYQRKEARTRAELALRVALQEAG